MRVDSSDNNEDFDDAYEEAREHHRPEPDFRTPESPRKRLHGRVAPAPREQESDSSPDEEFCILENDPGTGIVVSVVFFIPVVLSVYLIGTGHTLGICNP